MMRVSLLLLSFILVCWARNQAADTILMSIANGFPYNFKPDEIRRTITREDRIEAQLERLRGHVATRLVESLGSYELICPLSHLKKEPFERIEQELRQKGWNATWLPDEVSQQCGGQKGFLIIVL